MLCCLSVFNRAESGDYTAWSRDDWLRLINSSSLDQRPRDLTNRWAGPTRRDVTSSLFYK